ncbi:hypothetical protein [Streptomyces cavernicola]|uniref:DUF4190 domain-containing protein n=1 Tax=Streptomyces cavernicola TaxID=3043613 RepID=A0ABT6S9J1_9ACTN|nr:hypothetical protein [Streptomyces sp. B-S-A6]MDI3404123.1 hypothetical protein [Streptomyces sp. B-S-A6]
MPVSPSSENTEPTARPRRTAGRIIGGIVLLLAAVGLLYGGVTAVADPASVVASSSNSGRSPDTDAEAKIGGLLLCAFGISTLCFGIGLLTKRPAKGPQAGA